MFDQHSNIADGSRNKKCLISNQALRVLDNHKLQICAFYFPTFEKADCTMFVDGSVGWSVGVAINFPFPNCVTHPRTDQVPPCTIRRLSIKCILDKFWTASVMLLVWKKVNIAISLKTIRSNPIMIILRPCAEYWLQKELYTWHCAMDRKKPFSNE